MHLLLRTSESTNWRKQKCSQAERFDLAEEAATGRFKWLDSSAPADLVRQLKMRQKWTLLVSNVL